MKNKYLYTQLSAPIICFSAILGAILVLRYLPHGWYQAGNPLHVLPALLGIIILGFLSMFIWGKVLAIPGVLTKEEAKGYPYSRPWEKKGKYNSDD